MMDEEEARVVASLAWCDYILSLPILVPYSILYVAVAFGCVLDLLVRKVATMLVYAVDLLLWKAIVVLAYVLMAGMIICVYAFVSAAISVSLAAVVALALAIDPATFCYDYRWAIFAQASCVFAGFGVVAAVRLLFMGRLARIRHAKHAE